MISGMHIAWMRIFSAADPIIRGMMRYWGDWPFALILLRLSSLIMAKVVEDTRRVPVTVQYPKHLDTLGVRHLLRVARIRHRLVLVVL